MTWVKDEFRRRYPEVWRLDCDIDDKFYLACAAMEAVRAAVKEMPAVAQISVKMNSGWSMSGEISCEVTAFFVSRPRGKDRTVDMNETLHQESKRLTALSEEYLQAKLD